MIPVLYEATEQNFTSEGLGRLSEAISCHVIEERNGQYVLEMVYPVSGRRYSDIQYERIIYAVPSDGTRPQPFRIYKISKPLKGNVTIAASHISYQLKLIPCGPFTASTASGALQGLASHALEPCPFTFWTDKTTQASYKQETPAGIRERLGGTEGSILDVYGGEYEFDRYDVKLHNNRGADRGVTLRYGKNITDINQEENIENTVTGVIPFWYQEGTLVQAPAVYCANADLYPYKRTIPMDFTMEFETVPTVAQLTAKGQSYVANIGTPSVSINVSFVALWQTEEYKHIANLERVKLCDTITVDFEKLQIQAKAKVIRTDYDVLRDRYISIEVGDSRTDLSTQIATMNQEIKRSGSMMQQAIDSATNLITGGLGGYVVMKRNANGKPEEILIMDTEDVQTAVNVIRMNKNGIGFSTTGYNGPFTTAWTIDGSFVADFITAGTLRAIDIEGVNITGSTFTSSSQDNAKTVSIQNGWINCNAPDQNTLSGISLKNQSQKMTLHSSNLYGYNENGINTLLLGNHLMGFIKLYDGNGVKYTEIRGDDSGYYQVGTDGIVALNSYGLTVYDTGGHGRASVTQHGVWCGNSSGGLIANINNTTGQIYGQSLSIVGTKSRVADTETYGDRLLYCYETPTPYFGDLGEGKTDESGKCYVFLDDILDETIEAKYQVFLQAYGEGRLYVSERTSSYFVVEGEPNISFGWELKAPQKGYSLHRLEPYEMEEPTEDNILEDTYQYLNELLYKVEGEEVA